MFGYDAIASICFNVRDSFLVDASKVRDVLLVEVIQGCESGDAFANKTKNQIISAELHDVE